jgi:hypothetical protein
MNRKRIFVLVSISVIAAALLVWALFPKSVWFGLTDKNQAIGTYHSFEACKSDVEKRGGGWCGKGCTHYAPQEIANCKPLIQIPK